MQLTPAQRGGINGGAKARAEMRRRGVTYAGAKIWEAPEDDIVRRHYPDVDAIRSSLPWRTENAVRHRAGRLGVTLPRRVWGEPEFRMMKTPYVGGAPVPEIAAVLDRKTPRQVYGKASKRRVRRPRKPPKPVADPVLHQVRQRAYVLNISISELEREVGRPGAFTSGRAPNWDAIQRALHVLGGRPKIRWIP